jgi:hypothetical protein
MNVEAIKCGLGPERLSGCGTVVVETAPSSVSGFRAPGGRGLASTFSLAGLVSAGNSDIQGGSWPFKFISTIVTNPAACTS